MRYGCPERGRPDAYYSIARRVNVVLEVLQLVTSRERSVLPGGIGEGQTDVRDDPTNVIEMSFIDDYFPRSLFRPPTIIAITLSRQEVLDAVSFG